MRTGWSVIWKSGRNEKSFETEIRGEAEKKAQELKAKGYSGIKIVQCIF